MIEGLADLIPSELRNKSGSVFNSGRLAFAGQRDLYILGHNPGGDPERRTADTVAAHAKKALYERPDRWSEYVDERWRRRETLYPRGGNPMQKRIRHLLLRVGLDPREVPASNLLFVRSREVEKIPEERRRRYIDLCWPFHRAVIDELGVRVVLCLGGNTGAYVREKLDARRKIGEFVERNNRGWRSECFTARNGLKVVSATHPSRADWIKPPTDPSDLVKRALAG